MGFDFGNSNLLIMIGLCVVLVVFQYVLSVQNSKAAGLTLPVLVLAIGLALALAALASLPEAGPAGEPRLNGYALGRSAPAVFDFLLSVYIRPSICVRKSIKFFSSDE